MLTIDASDYLMDNWENMPKFVDSVWYMSNEINMLSGYRLWSLIEFKKNNNQFKIIE